MLILKTYLDGKASVEEIEILPKQTMKQRDKTEVKDLKSPSQIN